MTTNTSADFSTNATLATPTNHAKGSVPREATAFLIAVSICAVLLLLFFLYINKALCFRLCPNLSSLFTGRLRRLSVKQSSSNRLSCSAYDNEAHHGDNSSNESDDERYERSVLEKRLATSAPATAVVGSQRSLKTTTSPGDSLRSTASSGGSARHSTGSKTAGKRRAKNDEAKSRDTPDVIRDVDGARKTAAATASGDKLSDVVKDGDGQTGQNGPISGGVGDDVSDRKPILQAYGSYGGVVNRSDDVGGTAAAARTTASSSPAAAKSPSRTRRTSAHAQSDDEEHLFDVTDLQDREPIVVSKCGTLRVTFHYQVSAASSRSAVEVGRMSVTVHEAREIPTRERGGAQHSQVRLMLLPTRKSKHRTKIRSGADNPKFDETFTFKVPPEDLSSMGVRLRLYGCERMRRERMIGECIVSFSSLPAAMDYPLEQWLTLEPRSNITHGESQASLSSQSRSDSGSSGQSMVHGGTPELFLGLAYNSATGRLSVQVIKGSNFKNLAMTRAPDTYTKLTLMSPNGQEITHSKTSVRRGQPNPLYKETFMFQVAESQLPEVTLMVSVFYNRNIKRKEMIGWFSLGCTNSGDEELSHWNEMLESNGDEMCRWHVLLEP